MLSIWCINVCYLLITDLTDASLNTLGWRDWLGSVAGATILSVGIFTLNKLNLK